MDRILTREVHRNPPERTDIEQKEVKLPSLENIRNNSEDIETIRGSVKFLEEFRKEAELNSRSAIDDIQRKRLRTVNAIRSTILMINNLFSSNTYDRQTGEATWENHHAGLHPEGSW